MISTKFLQTVEKSATLLINEQSRIRESSGQSIIKFGFGQSPFLPPAFVVDALKQEAARKEYAPVQGLETLRKSVATFHNQVNGLSCSAADVLIAPGSKILIFNILACFKQLDVFIPGPSWVSYQPQAELLNHRVFRLNTSFEKRWRVLPEDLDKAFSKKTDPSVPTVLMLNFPGNPDGLTYRADELKSLAETAKRLNIIVIADEIYGLLDHYDQHISLAIYYPEGTITTTGLSKWCGAGGWRIGAAIVPPELGVDFKETLLGIASETYSCAPTPMQLAAIEAYNWKAETADYLTKQRAILRGIGNYCFERLTVMGVRLHAPEGGFYLFPDFEAFADKFKAKGLLTATDMCSAMLTDVGVALLPSGSFGLSDTYFAARLAYVDFVPTYNSENSVDVLSADFVLERDAPRIVEGMDRMEKWLAALA